MEEEEISSLIRNWDLLSIVQELIKDTSPTSETVDQLAKTLLTIVVELSKVNPNESKEKIAKFFDGEICQQIS